MMTEFQSPTEQSVEIAFAYSFVSTFTIIYKLYDNWSLVILHD